MTMNFDLTGRRALVTGASRGLGKAIADGLAELGAQVVGTSRDAATAAEIAHRYGTMPCVLDVTDIAGIRPAIEAVWADRPIDIVVNNAGFNRPQGVLDVDEDSWDAIFDTNLKGVFFVSQAVVRLMRAAQRPGSIVHVGSQAGSVGIEERSAYCASKGGLEQLTKVMAIELAEHQIRVNTVAPTFVPTELNRSTLEHPELRERFLGRIPMKRFGAAAEVAGAVAYLAGPMASLVTGHTLKADGGWTAW